MANDPARHANKPPPADGLTRRLRWRGMQMDHPATWELARHAIGPSGSLQFVTGMTPCMSIEWAACQSRPDLDRLREDAISEALDTARQDDEDASDGSDLEAGLTWQTWQQGLWHGLKLSPRKNQPDTCRLVRYDEANQRLIELAWTQPHDAPQTPDAVTRAVESFKLLETPADARRLTAFGLDVAWPEGWELAEAKARVGDVVLTFLPMKGHAKGARWVRVRRQHADPSEDVWSWMSSWRGWSWEEEPAANGVRVASTRLSWRRKRRVAARSWWATGQPVLVRVEAEGGSRRSDRLRALALEFEVEAVAAVVKAPATPADTHEHAPASSALSRPVGSQTNPLVVTNRHVQCGGEPDGIVLTVPVRYPWWLRGPSQRLLRLRNHRRLQLDPAGSAVWRALQESPEGLALSDLCRRIADARHLSPREAELSVCRFVQTLTQRGLVRLVGLGGEERNTSESP